MKNEVKLEIFISPEEIGQLIITGFPIDSCRIEQCFKSKRYQLYKEEDTRINWGAKKRLYWFYFFDTFLDQKFFMEYLKQDRVKAYKCIRAWDTMADEFVELKGSNYVVITDCHPDKFNFPIWDYGTNGWTNLGEEVTE